MSKQNTMDNAVIPLMSIWDAVNDLSRLRGIVAAVTYLTSPQHLKEDDEFEVFHEVFCDINDRLNEACDALEAARRDVKFMKEEAAR